MVGGLLGRGKGLLGRGFPWQRGLLGMGGSPWQGVSLAGGRISLAGGLLGRGVSLVGSPWQGVSLAGGFLGRWSPWQRCLLGRGSPWQGVSLAGGLLGMGGLPGGGSPWQGGLLGRGVSLAWGGLLGRGVLRQTPPVNRMTNRCKNITLPPTSFAGGNKSIDD